MCTSGLSPGSPLKIGGGILTLGLVSPSESLSESGSSLWCLRHLGLVLRPASCSAATNWSMGLGGPRKSGSYPPCEYAPPVWSLSPAKSSRRWGCFVFSPCHPFLNPWEGVHPSSPSSVITSITVPSGSTSHFNLFILIAFC